MKRVLVTVVVILLLAALFPVQALTHAQGTPQVTVKSLYSVNRYGYAVINETVTYKNNGTAAVQPPTIQLGFGNVTSKIFSYNVTDPGYTVHQATNGNQTVFVVGGGGVSVAAGASSSFSFKALVANITSIRNQTLNVLLVTRPFIDLQVQTMKLVIRMPATTQFVTNPTSFNKFFSGLNVTYFRTVNATLGLAALTQRSTVQKDVSQDFNPLRVYSASRVITTSGSGDPIVQDSLNLNNMGNTQLTRLTVAPLTAPGSAIKVVSSAQPPLLSPTTTTMSGYSIPLANAGVGVAADPGANYTITYTYPLAKQYYNVTGGVVSMKIPLAPPILTFVDHYSISMSLPAGVRSVQGAPSLFARVSPLQSGSVKMSYGLSIGWALEAGVPAASLLFMIVLVGLIVLRTRTAEEELPEETATERASAMIKAFEEKTSLINGLFEEIPLTDPNMLNKAHFDELRARLDAFRSRALQRLNEVKQKSTTKKFFDLLNQMHDTEREVDRAAKDMLNLYEQYYTKRMRKEVFDKLLPSYKKRLDKALNQLSDELNTATREAKLL